MTDQALRRTINAYKIQTVINLKGTSKKPWYLAEKQAAEDCRILYLSVELNPWKLPPPDKLAILVHTFQKGPYPMLVHCNAGADRAGLASVLYRVVVEHAPLEVALSEQLTWRYGHFTLGKARAMDIFFDLYRQTGTGKDLVSWIIEDYPSIYHRHKAAATQPA